MHDFPLAPLFLLALFSLFVLLVVLIETGILSYGCHKIGVSRKDMFLLLFLSLPGSYVNIPVALLAPGVVHPGKAVSFQRMQCVVHAVVLAAPVPGVGIVEPTLVPPFLTAGVYCLDRLGAGSELVEADEMTVRELMKFVTSGPFQ